MHFNYDFTLMFYLAGCVFFLYIFISRRKAMTKKRDLVQLRNPKTGLYVKIDRTIGAILSHKKSLGPYKGVPIHVAKKRKEGCP